MKIRPRAPKLNRRGLLACGAAAALAPRLVAPARAQSEPGLPRLRFSFDGQVATYTLFDNPTTRDLMSMLPLDLEIRDFSTNEKIAHLPRRLDEGGFAPFDDETPGDLCYFLGWGNLALFHGAYRFRDDLIRLGRIEGDVAPLLHKGVYPLRVELIS